MEVTTAPLLLMLAHRDIDVLAERLADESGCQVRSERRKLQRIMRGDVVHVNENTAECLAHALGYWPAAIWSELA